MGPWTATPSPRGTTRQQADHYVAMPGATMTDRGFPTRPLRQLSLARVAAYLSHDVGAQLFRNLALSPTVLDNAVPQDASDRGTWIDLPPPPPPAPTWPEDQVRLAFGKVPAHLIDGTGAEQGDCQEDEEGKEEGFWGMVYFNPETRDGDEGSIGVLNLWMSSEIALSQAGCGHPCISPSTFAGLDTVFDPVPYGDAQSESHGVAGPTLDELGAGSDAKLARLARETKRAIHWVLRELLPPLFGRRDGMLHLHGVSGLVEREAMTIPALRAGYRSSCLLFHRAPTTQDLATYDTARSSGHLHGLDADCLKPADLPAVQRANHIGFPIAYLRNAARISSCLRQDGEAVAWVATHGALTLASLHVVPAYRRSRSRSRSRTSPSPSPSPSQTSGSAGQDLVALYAARNWAALAPVLESLDIAVPRPGAEAGRAGVHPASLMATTEASNGAGLRFFARLGWDAARGACCWSAVVYPA